MRKHLAVAKHCCAAASEGKAFSINDCAVYYAGDSLRGLITSTSDGSGLASLDFSMQQQRDFFEFWGSLRIFWPPEECPS